MKTDREKNDKVKTTSRVAAESDLSAVEALVDAESKVPKALSFFVAGFASLFAFFHLYTGFFGMMEIYANLTMTVSLLLIIGFLYHPLGRKSWSDPLNKWFIVDVICILLVIAIQVYIFSEYDEITIYRTSMANTTDLIAGGIYLILVLELTRRVLGYPIFLLALFFLIQNLTAQWWPGWLHGPNVPLKVSIEVNFLQDNGIFAIPIKVCSRYLVLFLIFVALLLESGGGQKLLNIAYSVAGRFTGGPAKVAVIASSLLGSVQGAATANVAGTGSFTIPLMKESGFSPRMAGAIEAVSSSGAQLMPPIMGASAFVMAGFLKVSYRRVCLAAIIPALIYYVCAFATVHFYSVKKNLRGLPKEQLPDLRRSLKEGWSVLIPFGVLLFFIAKGYAMATCAVYGIIAAVICTMVDPSTRWTPTRLLKALEKGSKDCIMVVTACAAAGIVIGTFFVSGLGDTLARQIVLGSHGILPIALVICAVVSLILGMAMPTVAVYVTLLLVGIPALIRLGVPKFSAHFFCFYFGLLSAITPPVALAAFVAAGISGDTPMGTAFRASRIALPLYFVAFFLPYNPAMMWSGTATQILTVCILGIIGAISVAASTAGHLFVKTKKWETILLFIGGMALISPVNWARIAGIAFLVVAILSQTQSFKRSRQIQTVSSS